MTLRKAQSALSTLISAVSLQSDAAVRLGAGGATDYLVVREANEDDDRARVLDSAHEDALLTFEQSQRRRRSCDSDTVDRLIRINDLTSLTMPTTTITATQEQPQKQKQLTKFTISARTRELIDLELKYCAGGFQPRPAFFVRGKGAKLWVSGLKVPRPRRVKLM